jgi:Spy/CpxP family protein refolding chaperone
MGLVSPMLESTLFERSLVMRTFAKMALSVAAAAFAVSVSLAQGGRPGFGAMAGLTEGPMLLFNKSVQDELKLTDEQKTDLKKLQEKQGEAIRKVFEDAKGGGFEKIQEAMKTAMEDTTKALAKTADSLKDDQKKRFKQIQVQVKGVRNFIGEDDQAKEVQKKLQLTDKQMDDFKEQGSDLEKDVREVFKDVGRDPDKRKEAMEKVTALNKATLDKIAGSLTKEQKEMWKTLTGDKFDYKPEMPNFGGFGVRPGDKKSDKN